MHTLCKGLLSALFVLPLMPVLAWAQEPDSFGKVESRVRVGDTVRVIDKNGNKSQGRIGSVSATSLSLIVNGAAQNFSETTVREIKRRRHASLPTGGALGALIGGAAVGAACHGRCNAGPGDVIAWGTSAAVGAGAGVMTALLVTRYETVFMASGNLSVRVFPIFSSDRKSVRFSISF